MPKGDVFTKGLREGTESKQGGADVKDGHQTQVYPDGYHASRNEDGPALDKRQRKEGPTRQAQTTSRRPIEQQRVNI